MNLVNPFRFAGEYWLDFDGTDDVLQWTTPANDIHTFEFMFYSASGIDGSEGFTPLFGLQGNTLPVISLGSISGDFANETITVASTDRSYTTADIPSGFVKIKIDWNGSSYDIYYDDVQQTVNADPDNSNHATLMKADEYAARTNTGNYSDIGLQWLKLYDSGGLFLHYPLNEGSGTTAEDIEGTNDGTITGATWTKL